MANRKSKRVSRRTRMNAAKKVRENFRKQKKLERRHKESRARVPRALLLTDAEKEQIKFIKEQTEQRTAEHKTTQDEAEAVPGYIAELDRALQVADVVVEVVDYRDIASCRARDCEELVRKHNKRLHVYLNHYNDYFTIDCRALERDGLAIIRDLSVFDSAKSVCIFGNAKSGKFTLAKLIENRGTGAAFTRITTPVGRILPSTIMRGAVDEKHMDLLASFREIYPFLDPQSVIDFYKIRPYSGMEELLLVLGKAHSSEIRERRSMCAGALHILKDMWAGRIQWARMDGRYAFRFTD